MTRVDEKREKALELERKKRQDEYRQRKWQEKHPLFSKAIGVHTAVNFFARFLYLSVRPNSFDVPKEAARQNMDNFVHYFARNALLDAQYREEELVRENKKVKKGDRKNMPSLEEKLLTEGDHYVPYESIVAGPVEKLWAMARRYDLKGIIARPEEDLANLVYRGNTLLFLHRFARHRRKEIDIKIDKEAYMVIPIEGSYDPQLVRSEEMKEATARIPFFMDMSWMAAYIKEGFIVPALAVTFTLPHYNGLNFVQVKEHYKSRDKFLEILSHEMVHGGTVYLDPRREYLETKAYHVGKGSLVGEYAVAVNQRPSLIEQAIKFAAQFFMPFIAIPDKLFKYIPKVKTAWQIHQTTGIFRAVQQRLEGIYGLKGNYVLGRLTTDEIEEFYYTNDVRARISMKDSLKWGIMKENLREPHLL